MVKAWKEAKVHADTTAKYESVARAHGESVSMLSADWNQLLAAFKQKHGQHLHDTVLPAQSYAEAFEEMLSDGNLRAESLNQVVSVAEQEEQEQKKAEPQRHMSLHLYGQLSIQTERRFVSSVPTTPEQLRFKYKIRANCWLMGQMRQPGKHLFFRPGPQHVHRLPGRPTFGPTGLLGYRERIINPTLAVGSLQRLAPQAREFPELLQAGYCRPRRERQPHPAAPISKPEAREKSRRSRTCGEVQVPPWQG